MIRLVEGSDLSVRRTRRELGVSRSTFYAWYGRYREDGGAGLEPRKPATRRSGHFISESSVYRILKAHDLITSPATS